MTRLLSISIISLLAIVLWGCPYKSTVPLAPANEYVNKQVLGKWMPETERLKENPEYYLIEQRDTIHYDVEHFQFNEKEKDDTSKQYVCWSTNIDGYLFMNVQEAGQTEITFHRLDVKGDEMMTLYEVTSNIDERFEKSEDLYAFFDKYKKLSFFYSSEQVNLIQFPKK